MRPAPGRPRRYEPGSRDRIQINLDSETVQQLRTHAAQTGQSLGEIVEQLIRQHLK